MSSTDHDCRVCGESFDDEPSLTDHVEAEHPEQGMA